MGTPAEAPPLDDLPPPPGEPPAAARTRIPRWGWWCIAVSAVLGAVVIAGFVVHVDYSTLSPGEALALPTLVHVDGARTYDSPRGDIRLLFVRQRRHINVWRYVQARLDPDIDLFKDRVLSGGESPGDQRANAIADMADAKTAATKLALEAAGYTVAPSHQVVIHAVLPSYESAAAVLRAGDLITSADGRPVENGRDLRTVIGKHAAGTRVVLGIERDGRARRERVRVVVERDPATGEAVPRVGIRVFPHFDFAVDVEVDTGRIGGPSAGLAMTLALIDDLTPGDLTGGTRVAVTGAVDLEGSVLEVGAIHQKAVAARAARAQLFLVPRCGGDAPEECRRDLARATRRAGDHVRVVPVGTLAEALRVLRQAGGAPVVPSAPVTRAA